MAEFRVGVARLPVRAMLVRLPAGIESTAAPFTPLVTREPALAQRLEVAFAAKNEGRNGTGFDVLFVFVALTLQLLNAGLEAAPLFLGADLFQFGLASLNLGLKVADVEWKKFFLGSDAFLCLVDRPLAVAGIRDEHLLEERNQFLFVLSLQ